MDKMNELEWYAILPRVYFKDDKKIYYNIFNNVRFRNCLMDLKAQHKKDPAIDLKKELNNNLRYCFWGKAEYEIYINAFDLKNELKIDIYDQIKPNLDKLYAYLMQNWNKIPAKTYRQQENEKKKRLNGPGPKYQCAKCKDIIQSKSVHDFVWCKCKAIAIDGGGYYTKLTGNPEDLIYIGDK